MFKFLTVAVVGLALALSATEAFAGHRRCGGGYSYAPAPAVVPAPAPAPTAQAPQGNRTYSYQPVTQPNYGAYGSWVSGRTGRAYENATNKSLGRGF